MDPAVITAMKPYFSAKFYNPSATYLAAKQITDDVKAARAIVAKWFGAKPSEIIFTAGGTEANNLALFGVAKKYKGCEIIASSIEHESVLKPLAELKRQGHKIQLVKPRVDGIVEPEAVAKAVTKKTVLVSVMYANNEVGAIEPLRQIAKILQAEKEKRRKSGNELPLYFHSDACQAANYLSLQVHRLGVDLMTINSGKVYGPKQCGALYVSAQADIGPLILGGGQERGLRSGTENVANIIGFAKAVELAQANREKEAQRLQKLQELFLGLLKQKLPTATVNGSLKHRIANNIHITFAGADNERLMMQLEDKGILCGLGSACSASNEEPSHVLTAIGLTDKEAQGSLRFTMGRSTTAKDVKYTVDTLVTLV